MIENDKIIPLLKDVVNKLSEKDYDYLEKNGKIKNGTAKDIEYGVSLYPGDITYPPDSYFLIFDKYNYTDNPNGCLIEFDLWVDNEKSDLTLSAEVIKNDNNEYQIYIEDIHVL